jgi:hypothetical protein
MILFVAACEPALGHPTMSHVIPLDGRPVDLAAGDLDRDGRIDLVIANADGTVAVRLQRDGWIARRPIRARAHMIALGDIDANGTLDVLATDHDSADLVTYLGDGAGGFRAQPPVRTLAGHHNHGLVAADLDRDGDADAVVADQEARAIAVLLSDGRRLVASPPIALPAEPYPPAAGDLDADGDVDLVVPLIGSQRVAVLLGDGKGGFARPTAFATGRDRPYGIAIGDADGNGTADVIVSHDDTDRIAVLAGDGRGGLAAPREVSLGRRIGRPLLVDLDRDRAPELVGAGSGALVVARGPRFSALRTEPSSGWRVVAADLDGDGRPDLAVPDSEARRIQLWLATGPGSARNR